MGKDTHISPVAARVIAKCGGVKQTAKKAGFAESWVYRWTYPRHRGGTGGEVPQPAQRKLVRLGICEPADFFDMASE